MTTFLRRYLRNPYRGDVSSYWAILFRISTMPPLPRPRSSTSSRLAYFSRNLSEGRAPAVSAELVPKKQCMESRAGQAILRSCRGVRADGPPRRCSLAQQRGIHERKRDRGTVPSSRLGNSSLVGFFDLGIIQPIQRHLRRNPVASRWQATTGANRARFRCSKDVALCFVVLAEGGMREPKKKYNSGVTGDGRQETAHRLGPS